MNNVSSKTISDPMERAAEKTYPGTLRVVRTQRRRRLRGMLRVVTALTFLLVLLALVLEFRYPGFVLGSWRQLRYSTAHENRNLWFCISYWLDSMQKLTFDPEKKVWSFDKTPQQDMSEFEKGKLAFHRGDFSQAALLIAKDVKRYGESEPKLFWLAMSYMRLGETENCLTKLKNGSAVPNLSQSQHEPMVCTLPFTVFHDKPEYSREAGHLFQRLLDKYDNSNYLYRWLLNLSYMAIHEFPEGVPVRYRIQSEFIDTFYGPKKQQMEARYPYLSFEEGAHQLGITSLNTGRGVAVEDFKHDGFFDIVTCSTFEGMHFYKNRAGKTFQDQTRGSGLEGVKQCFAVVPVDYDNDGWVDLFVSRPFSHYLLLKNNGDGTFRDVTVEVGLWDPKDNDKIAATWIPAWADVNNDGKLDLFLSEWAFRMPMVSGIMKKPRLDSALFINENGHFVNRTKEYGLESFVHDYYYVGAAFGDYDGDGLPDLLLTSPLRKSTLLLRNVDGRHFVDSHLMTHASSGFTAAFLDVNHDGRLDIFIGGFGDAKSNTEQVVFGRHTNEFLSGHSSLLIQQPNGSFEEHRQVFDMPISTMGASWGDLTNSGCYDFYFGTGDPEPWFILPHLMYMGKPKGTGCSLEFENISMLQGFGNLQKGHGIVFFDFNNDGKQDVFSSLGGMWPGDAWASQLFINHSQTSNTWTKIRLRGRKSNYFGIGAMIRVEAENVKGENILRYYFMDQKTGFGGGPFLAHIGLADAIRIKRVEVTWPTSNCKASYNDVRIGELNMLDENKCFVDLGN
jgi:hypothetical protein